MNDSPDRRSPLQAYDNMDSGDLQHKVLELSAENEHVKNMLIGLNDKL